MKAYDIPVSKSAIKMLKRDFGFKGFLKLDGLHLATTNTNPAKWRPYLDRTEAHQERITLICRYASPGRLYTIARTIEHTFDTSLILYVESAVENNIPAAEAIQKFMDKYDLSEDDLPLATAYKRWQRYVKREKKRQFITLW